MGFGALFGRGFGSTNLKVAGWLQGFRVLHKGSPGLLECMVCAWLFFGLAVIVGKAQSLSHVLLHINRPPLKAFLKEILGCWSCEISMSTRTDSPQSDEVSKP